MIFHLKKQRYYYFSGINSFTFTITDSEGYFIVYSFYNGVSFTYYVILKLSEKECKVNDAEGCICPVNITEFKPRIYYSITL